METVAQLEVAEDHSVPPQGESKDDRWLYHETQQAALCGVHALNALLQGPFFNEIDLAEMAQGLDANERALMAEGGLDTAEFLSFAAEESANVSMSGMFSIQVLSQALQVYGLSTIPFTSSESESARAAPHEEWGFLCNLQEHWLTVRAVGGEWWNFNSLFKAPRPLSAFYLSAFLDSLQSEGYTIFVVRGQPPPSEPGSGAVGIGQHWLLASEARAQALMPDSDDVRPASSTRTTRRRPATEDDELQRALAASLTGVDAGFEGGQDPELAAAIAASLVDVAGASGAPTKEEEGEQNPPCALVDLPQLDKEPENAEGVVEIVLRIPSGERKSRRFNASDTVGHVAAFAAACGIDMGRHQLSTSYPRRGLKEWDATLQECDLLGKQLLYVEGV